MSGFAEYGFSRAAAAALAFLSLCAAGLRACAAGAPAPSDGAGRRPVQAAFKVVQWNIGHFAHGLAKHTAIAADESAAKSAEYRAMIDGLKPDFLGVNEFDLVFDKAGYTVANTGQYKFLDNVVIKGFDVKELFSADDQLRLSDHHIVGCVLEMKK